LVSRRPEGEAGRFGVKRYRLEYSSNVGSANLELGRLLGAGAGAAMSLGICLPGQVGLWVHPVAC
jgi:hypothetical protein